MGDKEGFIYRLWPSIESHRHQPHIAVWDLVSFLPNDGFHIYMDSELGHYKTATLLNENSFKFIMKCNSSSLEGGCKEKLKETKLSEGSYTSLTDGQIVAITYKMSTESRVNFLTNETSLDPEQVEGNQIPKVIDLFDKRLVYANESDQYSLLYSEYSPLKLTNLTQAIWMGIFKIILSNAHIYAIVMFQNRK